MPAKKTIEYDSKPAWDIELREMIYAHIRNAVRKWHIDQDEALWHINEAVSLLYVAQCKSEPKGGRRG
jgi:hypothetical protein